MARQRTLSSFRSLSDVIEKEKEFEKLREKIRDDNVVEYFEKIFPELSKICKAVKVSKSNLFLRVENSVWKSELNLQKSIIVERINKYFNDTVITSIKFL